MICYAESYEFRIDIHLKVTGNLFEKKCILKLDVFRAGFMVHNAYHLHHNAFYLTTGLVDSNLVVKLCTFIHLARSRHLRTAFLSHTELII